MNGGDAAMSSYYMKAWLVVIGVIGAAYLAAACATTATNAPKVDEPAKPREQDATSAKQRERVLADELDTTKKRAVELQSKLSDTQAALDKATAGRAELQKQLDDNSQLIETMKQRLDQLGQNVDRLAKERDQLAHELAEAAVRLEELRNQKAAAEATYRDIVAKLRSMIEAGQLKIVIRDGRMIIALPNDILFDSGRTDIKVDGKAALAKVAQVLTSVGNRKFLVAGHTDNLPIRTQQFPSNWELSTRRAVEVVHYLVSQNMPPQALAAAGYGEFDPIVPNDTADHRAQNRRIEIILLPNISELPSLDDMAPAPPNK